MNVLILHSLPPTAALTGREVGEFELEFAAQNVAGVLPGSIVVAVCGDAREIVSLIDTHRPDVVFNMCEAPLGRTDLEAAVAALFEWLGVRFTGSGSEALALCRRKDHTRAVLDANGIPIPRTGIFPCIVKPADEDGSAGVHEDSICHNDGDVERVKRRIDGPVIVEEFLSGREFVVSVWGQYEPDYVSIGETCFQNGLQLITYEAKWDVESAHFTDTPLRYDMDLPDTLARAIAETARAAWRALGIKGYMRVDIRLGDDGVPRVLDVNPNPELGPGVGVCRAVQEAGWSWADFVRKQVEWA